jgi:hypothetical protein
MPGWIPTKTSLRGNTVSRDAWRKIEIATSHHEERCDKNNLYCEHAGNLAPQVLPARHHDRSNFIR